jgi:NitT/TauT family transport system permease protein
MTTIATKASNEAPRRPKQAPLALRVLKSPLFARLLFPFVVLAVWLVSIDVIQSIWPFAVDVLPTPGEVWGAMWEEVIDPFASGIQAPTRENLYATFGRSLYRLGIGFAISIGLGTVIGLGMGLSKSVDAFFHDWVMAILAMPALAWALFVSLIIGFGDGGPITVVVLAGIPFVIINVREGVRNTPRELFDMGRAFGVSQNKITRHVLLPSLMPFFFAATRYAFSIGWKGLVIAEVFGGQDGAGWTIKFYYDAHRAHGVVAYAAFFIIFALILEKMVFERAAQRVFKWRPKVDLEIVEEAFDDIQGMDAPLATLSSAEAEQTDYDHRDGLGGEDG